MKSSRFLSGDLRRNACSHLGPGGRRAHPEVSTPSVGDDSTLVIALEALSVVWPFNAGDIVKMNTEEVLFSEPECVVNQGLPNIV